MQDAFYYDVIGALYKSQQLEKRAAAGDQHALTVKASHDLDLMAHLKVAGWAEMAPVAKKALVGGAAAMLPVTAGGAYLMHKANDTAENVRDKALQTALGVGGVGAGLLALHHGLSSRREAAPAPSVKTAADHHELLTKLATVSYLDDVLATEEQRTQRTDPDAYKEAHACRLLNAEHGVQLLRDLLDG